MSETLAQPNGALPLTPEWYENLVSRVKNEVLQDFTVRRQEQLTNLITGDGDFNLLTLDQAAHLLKMSKRRLRELCTKENKISYSVPNGKTILISEKNLKNYLKQTSHD